MDHQIKLYRGWPPWKRLEAAFQLYQFAKEIIKTRERRLHPHLAQQKLEKRVRSFFR